jgi:hypothetical protein
MFGITSVSNRHCSVLGCKKNATHVVGNTKYPYNLKNLFLCEEHLDVLYNELTKMYGEAFKGTLNESKVDSNVNGQELLKSYVKIIYEANGMLSKAKLTEFCNDNGIEVPDEANMRKIMECIFPELEEK